MKRPVFFLVATAALLLCGCTHYDFYIVEPAQFAQRVGKQPVKVPYAPMNYRMAAYRGHLLIDIENPTEKPVNLLANKSYLVDPQGLSHPVHEGIIAPHSYVPIALPPVPMTWRIYAPYFYHGPAWWWTPYDYPFYYDWAFYEPFPRSYTYEVRTPYDWNWSKGQVRLGLTYDQAGQSIEHQFVFDRREAK